MNQNQVRCSHLLQKHTESRNPTDSYRNKPVTRSKQEAIDNIRRFQEQISASKVPADEFLKLSAEYSECRSAGNKGDLGFFGPGQMQKPFEDASFKLNVGEISDVVDTDSGIHLILRLA